MGAIAAIFSRKGPAELDIIRRMLAEPSHYQGSCATVVCGACALGVVNGRNITDSFLSKDGPVVAAFSGKLDNAVQVGELATERGFRPASTDYADIVVAAFRAFGVDAPGRMRGVYAAVVTNGSELWCFRDHMGWRPLHYRDGPDRFVVASEPKQIVVGAAISREPNLEVLEHLLYGRLTKYTPSTLKGVDRVPHSAVITAGPTGLSAPRAYWHPADLLERSRYRPDEIADRFAEVFGNAVERSLTGRDVISLSGGIDSPAVAGFAAPLFREKTGRPMPALSTVYPNHPRVDESRYIELIARELGMELHTFTPSAGPWENLDYWVRVFDGPIPTVSFPEITEYFRLANQLGFENVLGGEVAEAVFNLNRHVIAHLVTRGRWGPLLAMSRRLRAQGWSWNLLGRYMITPFIPRRLALWYVHRAGLDFPQRVPDWMSAEKVNEVPFRRDLNVSAWDRWAQLQLRPFDGTSITMEGSEVAALLCGTTNRSPFGDVDVIEFFLGLPADQKFPDMGSKTLVRQMLRGRVPDEILDRRDKTVFTDYAMSRIDYGPLRKYLIRPATRMAGVDYDRLAARIERQDFKLIDFVWANDLVRIHAFLSEW